jgi:hypothetical protein
LGLPDGVTARNVATSKAATIANDIISNNFDRTVFQYCVALLCIPNKPTDFCASLSEFGHNETCKLTRGTDSENGEIFANHDDFSFFICKSDRCVAIAIFRLRTVIKLPE